MGIFGRKKINEAVVELKKDPRAKLIDVRTEEEYCEGHIGGSIHLPLDRAAEVEMMVEDYGTPLYVYCLSGARSESACAVFRSLGYMNVTNIGGIGGYEGALEKGGNKS